MVKWSKSFGLVVEGFIQVKQGVQRDLSRGGSLSKQVALTLHIIYLRKGSTHAYNAQSPLFYPFPKYIDHIFIPNAKMPLTSLTQRFPPNTQDIFSFETLS